MSGYSDRNVSLTVQPLFYVRVGWLYLFFPVSLYICVDLGQFKNIGTYERAIILVVRSHWVWLFIKIINMHNIYGLKYPNYDVNKNEIEMELRFLFVLFLMTSLDRPFPSELFCRLRCPGPPEVLSGGIYRFSFTTFPLFCCLLTVRVSGWVVGREQTQLCSVYPSQRRRNDASRSTAVYRAHVWSSCTKQERIAENTEMHFIWANGRYGGPKELWNAGGIVICYLTL
jgi:hypothetical protein